MINPALLSKEFLENRDVAKFSEVVLGVPLHEGQLVWMKNSWKLVNYLKPGNQWGKTMATAIKHIFHAVTKIQLRGKVTDLRSWNNFRYETLNTGKTYEVSKGVFEAIIDLVNGNVLLPNGHTNESMLKGWAIDSIVDVSNKPPEIHWWNGSRTLIRSYSDMGSSFKRKKLAYVSSDECGDIPDLKLFLNGTILPRVAFLEGHIDLIGTQQAGGLEFHELIEEALDEIKRCEDAGLDSDTYVQGGTLYENTNMSKDFIQKLENIADPLLREQIIRGEYVEYGDNIFSWEEVYNMFNTDLPYDEETGFSELPQKGAKYILSCDMAATEDETAVTGVRYGDYGHDMYRNPIEFPYKIVFHKGFKGKKMPLSMQYQVIMGWVKQFAKDIPYEDLVFIYDEGSLGGKNAKEQFQELGGLCKVVGFPGLHKSYPEEKARAVAAVKEVITRNRKLVLDAGGKYVDIVKVWGFLKASPKLIPLKRQCENYKLDDKNLKQDRFMTLAMAIHYIEKRRPKLRHRQAVNFDVLSGTV